MGPTLYLRELAGTESNCHILLGTCKGPHNTGPPEGRLHPLDHWLTRGLIPGSEVSVGGKDALHRSHMGTDGKRPQGPEQRAKMARTAQVSVATGTGLEESV